jgi:hypothetical protein
MNRSKARTFSVPPHRRLICCSSGPVKGMLRLYSMCRGTGFRAPSIFTRAHSKNRQVSGRAFAALQTRGDATGLNST